MRTIIAAILSRVCLAVTLVLLLQTAPVRASIILEDLGTPATPNDLNLGNEAASPASALLNPGPRVTQAVSPNSASAKNSVVARSSAGASPDTVVGDVSMLAVLNENAHPTVASVKVPNLDPGTLVGKIRSDDAVQVFPSLLKDPGTDVNNDRGSRFKHTDDLVFAGSQ